MWIQDDSEAINTSAQGEPNTVTKQRPWVVPGGISVPPVGCRSASRYICNERPRYLRGSEHRERRIPRMDGYDYGYGYRR